MRILAILSPGTNARCQFMDLLRGAQLAGHTVFFEESSLFIAQHEELTRAGEAGRARASTLAGGYASHLEATVRARSCDLVICEWAEPVSRLPWTEGPDGPVSWFESRSIPVVFWWLDAPFWAYSGQGTTLLNGRRLSGPLNMHVINNAGTADEMRRVLHLENVIDQEYGVDEVVFRPIRGVDRTHDLTMCVGVGDEAPTALMRECVNAGRGDHDTVQRIRRDQVERVRAELAKVIAAAAPDVGVGGATGLCDAWLAAQLADPDRPMLEKFRDATAGVGGIEGELGRTLLATGRVWANATRLVRMVDSWQRAFTAALLSRRFKALIVGRVDASWDSNGWDVRGDRTGSVGYEEMCRMYSMSAVGLNVMRYQDDVGLNPKTLEIAASGRVALQRWRRGLDEMFKVGEEIAAFRTPAQAAEQLAQLIARPSLRDQMAAAGLSRVRSSHTWRHAAGSLMEKVEGALATQAPAGTGWLVSV